MVDGYQLAPCVFSKKSLEYPKGFTYHRPSSSNILPLVEQWTVSPLPAEQWTVFPLPAEQWTESRLPAPATMPFLLDWGHNVSICLPLMSGQSSSPVSDSILRPIFFRYLPFPKTSSSKQVPLHSALLPPPGPPLSGLLSLLCTFFSSQVYSLSVYNCLVRHVRIFVPVPVFPFVCPSFCHTALVLVVLLLM